MDTILGFMRHEQEEKLEKYRVLNQNVLANQILFTGSSLMEQFPINELLMTNRMDKVIYNRGIGGFTTDDMLEHMEEMILGIKPSKIFINIGTNDISQPDYKLEKLITNYEKILIQIQQHLPEACIYTMAYYPVNETDKRPEGEWGQHMFDTRNNENIKLANQAVEQMAGKKGCFYIDVNDGLTDERGMLKKEYTIEGVHMYGNAYQIILNNMRVYL